MREVSWIDPAGFSDPSDATCTLAFLCPGEDCRHPTVLLVAFLPGQEVKVKSTLPSSSVYGSCGKQTTRRTPSEASPRER